MMELDRTEKNNFTMNKLGEDGDQALESWPNGDKCKCEREDMSLSRTSISRSKRLRWKFRFQEKERISEPKNWWHSEVFNCDNSE